MKIFATLLLGFAFFGSWGVRAAEISPRAGSFQLVLVSGTSYTVNGPVERRGERYEFRDAAGRLMMVDARQVREVRPLGAPVGASTQRPAAPVLHASQSAAQQTDPPVRYTNADLPPTPQAPEGEAEAEAEAQAATPPESPADESSAPAPAETGPEIVETPKIVDGHDESWWRRNVAERRQAIADLERKENDLYRELVCAQHGLTIGSSECNALLLPKANAEVPQSLAQRLRDARAQLEQRRQQLADFLARAFERGVPTAWLLEKPED